MMPPNKDGCVVCDGTRGGVPGNENLINNLPVCDYCLVSLHRAEVRGLIVSRPTLDKVLDKDTVARLLFDARIERHPIPWESLKRNTRRQYRKYAGKLIAMIEHYMEGGTT